MLKSAWFLFHIEVTLLLRRSQEWLYPLGFFVIVICLFPFAFTPDPQFLQKFIPGCIWITALLASLLSVENIFASELEEGHLEQLVLSQIPLSLILLIKLGAQWLVTELPLILLIPLFSVLFHLSFITTNALCLSLLLGTPILTLLGSLGVALTLGLKQPGILLGLLILPLATPVLIFGVSTVQQAQAGFPITGSLALLSSLTIISLLFIPLALATTLKISLDD